MFYIKSIVSRIAENIPVFIVRFDQFTTCDIFHRKKLKGENLYLYPKDIKNSFLISFLFFNLHMISNSVVRSKQA